MPFELAGRNITVAGEFNSAIIQPRWLVAQGLLGDGQVEVLISDSPGMPRVFKFQGFKWEVGRDRLVLTCVEAKHSDPGCEIAKILGKLPHTPITGLGHNFLFESHDVQDILIPRIGESNGEAIANQLGQKLNHTDCTVAMSSSDDSRLRVRVVSDSVKQTIDLNFHFDVGDAGAAEASARESQQCRERAHDVVRILAKGL